MTLTNPDFAGAYIIERTCTDFTANVTVANDTTLSVNIDSAYYQWIDCHMMSEMPGEINQELVSAFGGDFAVIVNDNGCIDTSDCITHSILELLKHEPEKVNVYPNPSSGQINMEFENFQENITLQIINLQGQLLFEQVYNNTTAVTLNTKLPKGVYYVKIGEEYSNNQVFMILIQ